MFMVNGYMGKLLRVDLDHEKITEEALHQDYTEAFIGGSGLASRYLCGLVTDKTDPLGADNPLIVTTGPLTDTNTPCCDRFNICARSPLTDFWGLDSYQTQELIKGEIGRPKASIACIGIAGEKKSKIAAIINDQGRAAARTGMGTVMGSEKLKAIAVSGDAKPLVAKEAAFKEVVREAYCLRQKNKVRAVWSI